MNVAGAQAIWVLGLAAVLVAYSSAIFHALKRIARAVGMFFEAKRSTAAHAGRKESPVPLHSRRHEVPSGAPSQQTARPDRSNVTAVMWWRGPPATPTRPWEAIVLVFLSTTAMMVAIALWLMFVVGSPSSGRVISTGANEAIITQLPDGSVLSLSANSTLKVAVTDQHWGARLMEGAAVFDVPANLRKPFVVETVLMTATAAPGAKFRVAIGSSVHFDVYEGAVKVYRRGAKVGAAARLLHKGDSYRVPIGEAEASLTMARASPKRPATGV